MPSHHSSSSHSSHSSHHSSSHSHSSSRSYHSSSSHSSRSSSSYSSRPSTPSYRSRNNQPSGYKGKNPRIYRCKTHDYVYYSEPWTDEKTGQHYRAGYYDEEGNFYEDIVFSQHGKILDNATAVCRCDYCHMEDSRPWPEREKPCTHCGGTMTVISQVDDLTDSAVTKWNIKKGRAESMVESTREKVVLIIMLVLLSPCLFGGVGAIIEGFIEGLNPETVQEETSVSTDSNTSSYNMPDLSDTMYLVGSDGTYKITDQSDYKDNYETGNYKKLVLDSDGNYYDKSTEGYAWLNTDIDPPQFQYWFEGISSEYGEYGWMEYDNDEDRWYIELSQGDWQPLDSAVYEANADRLWHIDYDF